MSLRAFVLLTAWACLLGAQSSVESGALAAPDPQPAAAPASALALEDVDNDASQRTTLNLLGQVDTASGEGRRNENVSLTLIDNNVLKELNRRMGTTATADDEFQP